MKRERVGLWLVGAFGGVGTTITLGLAAMARGLTGRTGLVTENPQFAGLPLPLHGDFVIGGHDIRRTSFVDSAEEFRRGSGVIESEWIRACREELDLATARVRAGTLFGANRAISRLGEWTETRPPQTARQAIDRIAADLAAFTDSEAIDHLIVLNVASTEPPFVASEVHQHWDTLSAALADGGTDLLPVERACTLWLLCAAATRISTSRPVWAARSRRSRKWPARPARSMPVRTARPARR